MNRADAILVERVLLEVTDPQFKKEDVVRRNVGAFGDASWVVYAREIVPIDLDPNVKDQDLGNGYKTTTFNSVGDLRTFLYPPAE